MSIRDDPKRIQMYVLYSCFLNSLEMYAALEKEHFKVINKTRDHDIRARDE